MRRMYSEQELTKIIKEVSEAYISELIEEGEFDDDIASYVDAYLVEHPVDITALEGQTIAPAVVNATTSINAPSGAFTNLQGGVITGDSIIENMSGYSFSRPSPTANVTYNNVYIGAVKNGNKLTLVLAINLTKTDASVTGINLGRITLPQSISDALHPTYVGEYLFLDNKKLTLFNSYTSAKDVLAYIEQAGGYAIDFKIANATDLTLNEKYYCRYEVTFLLSNSLAA